MYEMFKNMPYRQKRMPKLWWKTYTDIKKEYHGNKNHSTMQ